MIPEEFSKLVAALDKYADKPYEIEISGVKPIPCRAEQRIGWQTYEVQYKLSMAGKTLCETLNHPHTDEEDKGDAGIETMLANNLRWYVRQVPQERITHENGKITVAPRKKPESWNGGQSGFSIADVAFVLGTMPGVLYYHGRLVHGKNFSLEHILQMANNRRLQRPYVLAKLDVLRYIKIYK